MWCWGSGSLSCVPPPKVWLQGCSPTGAGKVSVMAVFSLDPGPWTLLDARGSVWEITLLRCFQKHLPPSSLFIALALLSSSPSFPLPPSHPHLFTDYMQYWWWYHMACGWTTGAVTRDTCSHQNLYVWD